VINVYFYSFRRSSLLCILFPTSKQTPDRKGRSYRPIPGTTCRNDTSQLLPTSLLTVTLIGTDLNHKKKHIIYIMLWCFVYFASLDISNFFNLSMGSPPRTRDSHFQITIHFQHYLPSLHYLIYCYGCS
jgi:hypothetical protein